MCERNSRLTRMAKKRRFLRNEFGRGMILRYEASRILEPARAKKRTHGGEQKAFFAKRHLSPNQLFTQRSQLARGKGLVATRMQSPSTF
jgi:hypothetical protein